MRDTRFDHVQPITADDTAIAAALAEAHIPSLLMSLVHLTGDLSLLRDIMRAPGTMTAFLSDPQGGIAADDQARIRERALDVLRQYRDSGSQAPPPPPTDTIREMTAFMIGAAPGDGTGALPEDYVQFLLSELALDGSDPYGAKLDDIPAPARRDFHVVVIGAGMSGLLAAIRLREAGISFTVVEKNADVGGTWFENVYPGCRVDSPNHTYSYSFEPNDWPQHFSQQAVLREYFAHCATKYQLRDHIRFGTEVQESVWDEGRQRWSVHARGADGQPVVIDANAVICAVGQLNRPRFPDIPGRERFAGTAFHSARWEHEHDLRGKRIAVIGTGASAFQFVPEIAKVAGDVVVFQRTPPWVMPTENYHADIPAGKHWLLNHVPYYAKWFRFSVFWRTSEGLLPMVKVDSAWKDTSLSVSAANEQLRLLLIENIKANLGNDPDLVAKCTPKYPPGGKRMLLDNGNWLRTLKRDNVHLVTDPISEITAHGIRTESGAEHPADVLIYGTGFHASHFFSPMKFKGIGGRDLHAHWNGDPRAYMGITIPQFPNLFCLYGPNTNIVVNGSIIFFSECEMRYVLGCLKLLLAHGHAAMNCRQDVHDAYNERIDAGNRLMAWGTPHVRSWYKNANGRVTQNWPFTLREYWQQTQQPQPEDYQFT
jgi:4-hydroxyacetophenone monooxygenase